MGTAISVIVLGYGVEPHLTACLSALDRELREEDELILVDNGIEEGTVDRPELPDGVIRIGEGVNLGFAGGCNLAAQKATRDVLVFVNSDAIVRPGSLAPLVAALEVDGVGIAGGCLRLADQPHLVNAAGNPLQFTGVTWAGGCGEPAEDHAQPGPIPVATGGFFAVRRPVWDALGGFDPAYFAYHEDTDLSLRCWMSGLAVEYVPTATADHYYEFSRNPRKMYLVERNRLLTVLTDYPAVILRTVLPALLVVEPALLVMALLQGWAPQKLRAWWWLVRNVPLLRARRAKVQQGLRVSDEVIAGLMSARIDPPMIEPPPGMSFVNAALSVYWAIARSAIRQWGTVRSTA
ncbi:glycosyltransferase family 2 protein [Pedococcus sp. 5OH_020]|uniref:glycosyltransferase family 2 protein n=1 Tax=Pedococcus sp. 5OH_020 TaxID=2989814 RepID=UPI0022E9D305|nr:glycosyltransferase family 2 protein [Pedococcus sp. 5OH_020]